MNLIKVFGCLMAAVGILCSEVNAQTSWLEPVPSVFGANDTIRLDLFAGEAGDPLTDVLQISAEMSCTGCTFSLEEAVPALAFSSWFANDPHWQLTSNVSTNGKTLYLEASRTNGRPRSGHGYVASLADIIIVIEEINKREPVISLTKLSTRRSSGLMYHEGKIDGQGPEVGTLYRVVNATGITVLAGAWDSGVDVRHLPTGLYWMMTGSGTEATVFRWIQP